MAAELAEELIHSGKLARPRIIVSESPEELGFEDARIESFPRTRAYIKIEDGCNNRCSYCIIPTARGRVRSKKPSDVIDEINRLTDGGCPEIVLTGIETDAYGLDLDSYRLPDLIEDIAKSTNAKRIRLGSLDPSLFTKEFVDRVCAEPIMLPHYHISMQSGCSETLRQMRRRVNAKGAHEALERIRAARGDVQFSADIIVGFPGETDDHFEETLEFIRRERFLNLHVFQYSKRAGTEAAARKDQVPAEIKKLRSEALISEQKRIHAEILNECIGKEFELLCETTERGADGRLYAIGHTPSFIQLRACCGEGTEKGCTVRVRAESSDGVTLLGSEI
jgi:threonylcarbamoyladenosine tRNA methylthiotransferase MtaB